MTDDRARRAGLLTLAARVLRDEARRRAIGRLEPGYGALLFESAQEIERWRAEIEDDLGRGGRVREHGATPQGRVEMSPSRRPTSAS